MYFHAGEYMGIHVGAAWEILALQCVGVNLGVVRMF
jgi:hypothetical protein